MTGRRYDSDAQRRHEHLEGLALRLSGLNPRLDDPTLQAELEELRALEAEERLRQRSAEMASAARDRISARQQTELELSSADEQIREATLRAELEELTTRTDAFRGAFGFGPMAAAGEPQEAVAPAAPLKLVPRRDEDAPSEPAHAALGATINDYRIECGWSYEEMASVVGLARSAITETCSGRSKPQPRSLKAIADAFTNQLKRPITVLHLLGSEPPSST